MSCKRHTGVGYIGLEQVFPVESVTQEYMQTLPAESTAQGLGTRSEMHIGVGSQLLGYEHGGLHTLLPQLLHQTEGHHGCATPAIAFIYYYQFHLFFSES